MRIPTSIRHGGPPLLLAASLALPGVATADGMKIAPQLPLAHAGSRYVLAGSLTPVATPPAQGGSYALSGRVDTTQDRLTLQQGAQLALLARLAVSPLVCYGDTIFRDGFDL